MFVRKLFSSDCETKRDPQSNKWQKKLSLAQINPEPDLDLTDCAIKCLPKGVYSQCRIFHKNRLLLSDNCLSILPDDCDNLLADLIDFCAFLDLSRNQLLCLPINLGNLVNLKELHLSHNMIASIPGSFVNLKSLQVINISHNQLAQFPTILCDIKSLKCIDISYNQLITHLPSTIINLKKLEKLEITGTNINHPPKRICDQGTESLYKFFTNDQLINDQIGTSKVCSPSHQIMSTTGASPSESEHDNLSSYYTKKDEKKKRLIEFEKKILEENKLTEATNRKIIDKRQEVLMKMKQDQLMVHKSLESFFAKKIEDKSSIIKTLTLIEGYSEQLVAQLKSLRSNRRSLVGYGYNNGDGLTIDNESQLIDTLEEKLQRMTISKELTKESQRLELIKEDESLYQAICGFIEMKNTQNRILSEQIGLIECQLYHLTNAEIQRKNTNLNQKMDNITKQRLTLAALLKEVIDERDGKSDKRENSSIVADFINRVTSMIYDGNGSQIIKENLDPHLNKLEDSDLSLSQLYSPLFSDGAISLRQLADSTNDHLVIKEEHIRKHANLYLPMEQLNSPSAPQLTEIIPKPSAPPMKLYQLIECVICLDEQSGIILIPCGHVCTCISCARSIDLCPLCRSEISEKIDSN